MSIVLAVAIGVAAGLLVLVLLRRKPESEDPAVAQLRTDVQSLRDSSERSVQSMATAFSSQLQLVTSHVQQSLADVTSQLGGRLDAINQQVTEQVNQSANLMSASSHAVTERIASVHTTFAGLQKQVGEMTEQARQLSDLSKSVTAIEYVLRSPKMRGNFGEEQLETLLGLVFARQQFVLQHRFASGEIADALLLLPPGNVVVDSKFPLENFRRIAEAATEEEKKSRRRDFLRDVHRRVDEIATRYIRPAEGTLPFALMYVPAENVYYETIIRDDDGDDLYRYCLKKRVVPVSPNSFYAYLQTIMVGVKGLQVGQRADAIVREIESLRIELGKFSKAYETVVQHIRNASSKLEDGTKLLNKVELRVESLAGNGVEQAELFAEERKPLRNPVIS
ncbi:MAG TPA: DNA recombination protein RmuC [Candidatus Angelobacter sp.]|nr:DNA recombination protein RmuC [Candidatus Angelobacter sp.]